MSKLKGIFYSETPFICYKLVIFFVINLHWVSGQTLLIEWHLHWNEHKLGCLLNSLHTWEGKRNLAATVTIMQIKQKTIIYSNHTSMSSVNLAPLFNTKICSHNFSPWSFVIGIPSWTNSIANFNGWRVG